MTNYQKEVKKNALKRVLKDYGYLNTDLKTYQYFLYVDSINHTIYDKCTYDILQKSKGNFDLILKRKVFKISFNTFYDKVINQFNYVSFYLCPDDGIFTLQDREETNLENRKYYEDEKESFLNPLNKWTTKKPIRSKERLYYEVNEYPFWSCFFDT